MRRRAHIEKRTPQGTTCDAQGAPCAHRAHRMHNQEAARVPRAVHAHGNFCTFEFEEFLLLPFRNNYSKIKVKLQL